MMLIVFFSSRISPLASTVIFLRQISLGHGGRNVGDVANLVGQVAGHRIHAIGEILPRTGDTFDFRLPA